MVRMRAALLSVSALCLAAAVAVSATAQPAARTSERPLTFRTAKGQGVGQLAVVTSDADGLNKRRETVTDVMLRLMPAAAGMADPLSYPNLSPRDARTGQPALFHADLIVVAGGRLHVEEGARCTAWVADTAQCTTGCEGGTFALSRDRRNGRRLRISIGEVQVGEGGDGIRIAACSDDESGDRRIAPQSGRLATITLEAKD